MVKCLPTMRETQVQSLGREDPLEKEMTTHSSTLAWKIPWTEEPGRLWPMGHKESDTTERLHFYVINISPLSVMYIVMRGGTPLFSFELLDLLRSFLLYNPLLTSKISFPSLTENPIKYQCVLSHLFVSDSLQPHGP